MRVAHFIQRYPPALGGSEAYFARLGRQLAQQGDDVTVFTSTALELEALWSNRAACAPAGVVVDHGVTIRRYPVWHCPGRRYLLKALSLMPHPLWQCLTLPCNPICPGMWLDAGRNGPAFDVVHASAFPYAWPIACARRLARRRRVPLLVTPFLHLGDHDNPSDPIRRRYTAKAFRWLLCQADGIFVQTSTEREAAIVMGAAPERVHLQGLGVDTAECTGGERGRTRRHWQVADATVVIGHLANQSREKGTADLLLALEPLWKEGLDVHLVLAGPQMPNFRAHWHEFQRREPACAERRVTQLGPLSEQQKKDFFAGIDVFVLPSRCDSFGLVLLEAWANGIPNVAYRAGGIADVIRHGADGLLVPCGDLAGLTDALRRLGTSADERRSLGDKGRRRLGEEFRWANKLEVVRRVALDLRKKRSDRSGHEDAANLVSQESVRCSG